MLNILTNIISPIIKKFIPDNTQQEAALSEMMSATATIMVEEAKSSDTFVRRARPSFLYVMYILLLSAIPTGILFALDKSIGISFVEGVKYWFSILPSELYSLLKVCFGLYVSGRSAEKILTYFKSKK